MRADWTGFYSPSYRLMLQYAGQDTIPDDVWSQLAEMHQDNPIDEGHWEFLALGYLLLFEQGECLSEVGRSRLSSLLLRFKNNHPATNWRLIAQVVRRRIEGGLLSKSDVDRVRLKQSNDGFLQDIPGDQSTQYHAFLLFLIMRFACPNDDFMRLCVSRAFDWLTDCHQKYGDPSPLGRGRFKLFGYAAMAGVAALSGRWKVKPSDDWCAKVWSHLLSDRSSGALSSKWDGPYRNYLLHGYNTVDDYPAFVSVMTYRMFPASNVHNRINTIDLWWHRLDSYGSGLLADLDARVRQLMT